MSLEEHDGFHDVFEDQLTMEEWEAYLQNYEVSSFPDESVRLCAEGVFQSICKQMAILILCSLLQGFSTPLRLKSPRFYDVLLCWIGLACLAYILPTTSTVYLVTLYAVFFVVLKALCGGLTCFKLISGAYSFMFLIGCQNLLDDAAFVSFRGALMIQIMKSVSISFDLSTQITGVSNFSLLAYLLNPGTLVFGPFITYDNFYNAKGLLQLGPNTFFKAFVAFLQSLVFLFTSTCLLDTYFSEWYDSHSILKEYKTALSFRLSHYYICYLSLASCLFSGIEIEQVSDWKLIEFPRSMVDVVVGWNVPMNHFLHKCVFNHSRKYGHLLAVMTTFLASSLLHGFNFQLTAVLLSLGIYSFAENQFRSRLSRRMNACVKARKCFEDCCHTHKSISVRATLVNFLFCLLSVYHLIYLGMVFDDSESQTSGYSMAHTISRWCEWNFSSHIVTGTMLLLGYTVL
ncbi:hypothetical protein L596_014849 [Steinernema carpocapsae]|uniref:Protein-serine O-palmitoleoyltransferase porcupine n=1 Tax=Steinernema carpocapsae TaxID=34508 RepID=A0A4U5ND30_STECR|nr:hypothetical protein L596_014849 [Steinernema carpocapsae]